MDWKVPKIWQGGDVWIIGGGPSIPIQFQIPDEIVNQVRGRTLPLTAYSPYMKALHSKHTIGVNVAFMLGNWIDILFFGDNTFFLKYKNDLLSFPGLKISCTPKAKALKWGKFLSKDSKHAKGISNDPKMVSWNLNSGAAAISIAANAGAKRIFLVGFDMILDKNGNQHWHNQYKKVGVVRAVRVPPFTRHREGFTQIAADAKSRGIEIINVSPDSALTQFPKVTLKEALALLDKKDVVKGIEKMYQSYFTKPLQFKSGDINEHLPTLRDYVSKVNHVTEMGVRHGASTIAIGAGNPKIMVSYDIVGRGAMRKVTNLLEQSDIDFKFVLGDILKLEIDETDMLFIDTLHTYNQLSQELLLHEGKVKKYIILHDTVSFAETDEVIYPHASHIVKGMKKGKAGLMNAVKDFLKGNKNWELEKHFTNNNGLTVLRRVK